MKTAEELANEHWGYIEALTRHTNTGVLEETIILIKFHYLTAFVHGYKHGRADKE